jgi:ornithine decarboxylase
VTDLGASKEKIIFAHPVKSISDLKYAAKNNIVYTTFDSLSELDKITKFAPHMKCILRIRVDNPTARVQLGLKYGCTQGEYQDLIDKASHLGLDIVGTSFHVGSASKEPKVFEDGIQFSRKVFEYAKDKGYMCNVLDIGGGFTKETFKECAKVINDSFEQNFGEIKDRVKVIAEPGRYFAEETFCFFTPIVGSRKREKEYHYWIGDGLYGSFNCILYDGQKPSFDILRNPLLPHLGLNEPNLEEEHPSVLFGQTCDSADKVATVNLPFMRNGDYLMCKDFGAYTLAGACHFNGIPMPDVKIFYGDDLAISSNSI